MYALDGNAIAGSLYNHFGHEMTMAHGRCAHCNATWMLAELRVYLKAPGAVARCPTCDEVVMVIVEALGSDAFFMPALEMVD
jgi:phage FluMu protein Com